jgi:hypothetical protein
MTAPSDGRAGAPRGHRLVHQPFAPLVTITEDAQQPSITKLAQ